jgi:hypothetical protein
MRIDDPWTSPVFLRMDEHLDGIAELPTLPLGAYVGRDPARPLAVREVTDANDHDLEAALRVYRTAFPGGPTDIEPAEFRRTLSSRGRPSWPGCYHLWAIRTDAKAQVEGVASFFTFARAGFGGYIALAGSLRGTGRFPLLLARIEEQMIRDRTGASGWFIECDPHQEPLFKRFGFDRIDCVYRQPPLASPYEPGEAPPLLLMYKDFGRNYEQPVIHTNDFLSVLGDIYRAVYDTDPKESRFFADLRAQTAHWPDGKVRFR